MTKNILVVGGAGFIGSNMCRYLISNKDVNVICVDNLYTGSYRNIQPLLSFSNFKFIEHDIVNPLQIREKLHQIYNFACPASPIHYQRDPIYTAKINFIGILNVLELAYENQASLLQASTSEIYGNPLQHPQPESYCGNVNTIGPRSCYDEGKRIAETLCADYHKSYGIDTKIARIFNTYGPNMQPTDGRVISNFINQALKGEPITIYGDGLQTRSFCYIDDLIPGLIALMESDINTPINLGNPEEINVKTLAQIIINMTDSSSILITKELPEDDPIMRKPDISSATKNLCWSPCIELNMGLSKTIHYFKNIIESENL